MLLKDAFIHYIYRRSCVNQHFDFTALNFNASYWSRFWLAFDNPNFLNPTQGLQVHLVMNCLYDTLIYFPFTQTALGKMIHLPACDAFLSSCWAFLLSSNMWICASTNITLFVDASRVVLPSEWDPVRCFLGNVFLTLLLHFDSLPLFVRHFLCSSSRILLKRARLTEQMPSDSLRFSLLN